MTKKMIILMLSAVLFFSAFRPDAMARDLIASVGIIPPHAEKGEDGQPQGGFVEVVKAIDRVYTDGHISIRLFPIARAISNVVNKHSDFFIPYIPNPKVRVETLPFAFTSEAIVKVSFVLYSRADRPALPMNKLGDYKVETLRGAAPHFSFPIGEIDSFRQGIQKVVAGRTDGFIAEQDATDKIIRENKIKNIRRTLYATWDSSIVIPKGPEGREIDRIVSDALLELKRTGELRKITDKIHRPFSDWQPYEMNW